LEEIDAFFLRQPLLSDREKDGYDTIPEERTEDLKNIPSGTVRETEDMSDLK
jgi:hypothetical protein